MKKYRTALLIVALCLLLPAAALADDISIKVGSVEMVQGTSTTYWTNGSTAAQTAPMVGWNARLEWPDGAAGTPVLTLNGARITGSADNAYGAGIYAGCTIDIVLEGTKSTVTASMTAVENQRYAIYAYENLKISSAASVALEATTPAISAANMAFVRGINVIGNLEISGQADVAGTAGKVEGSASLQSAGIGANGTITVGDSARLTGTGGGGGYWGIGIAANQLRAQGNAVVAGYGAASVSVSYGLDIGAGGFSVAGSAQVSGLARGASATSAGMNISNFASSSTISGGRLTCVAGTGAAYNYGINHGFSTKVIVSGGTVLIDGSEAPNPSQTIQISDGFARIQRMDRQADFAFSSSGYSPYYAPAYLEVAPAAAILLATDGNGTVSASGQGVMEESTFWAGVGSEVTLHAFANEGYQFKEWHGAAVTDNRFIAAAGGAEIKAVFEAWVPAADGTAASHAPVPQTGDAARPLFWLALALSSLMGSMAICRKNQKMH